VKRIDHVGVAVSDLEKARAIWDALLGQVPAVEEVEGEGVLTAMYPCGIELLEPLSDQSPISRFLDRTGGGIHHVTLEVEGLEDHLERLRAAGVDLIHAQPVQGAGGARIAFVHPRATGGVLLELKEKGHA